jgi:hypothetical protein
MKKFTLFLLGGLLAFTISANAQQATLRIYKNYEVAIDGQYYSGNRTISNLSQGYHQIQVYHKTGFIAKTRKLVSSSSFNMRNSNVMIDVDQNGQLQIYQDSYSNNNNGGYDNGNGDRTYDGTRKGNGKGYGPYNNPGRGHKYGLYKNKNKKNKNHGRHDDDRYDD